MSEKTKIILIYSSVAFISGVLIFGFITLRYFSTSEKYYSDQSRRKRGVGLRSQGQGLGLCPILCKMPNVCGAELHGPS